MLENGAFTEISSDDANAMLHHPTATVADIGEQVQSTIMPVWESDMFDTANMMPPDEVSLTTPLGSVSSVTAGGPRFDGQFSSQIEDELFGIYSHAIIPGLHPTPTDFQDLGSTNSWPTQASHETVAPAGSQSALTTLNSTPHLHAPCQIAKTLHGYTSMLLSDSFHTPLLHFKMYSNDNPDITLLTATTMALACGDGLVRGESASFMKRAVEGEQQRLIDQYVSQVDSAFCSELQH
jgi:hypothetical protein